MGTADDFGASPDPGRPGPRRRTAQWPARLSFLDSLGAFLQFPFSDPADAKRPLDPDGSSAPLLERPLHARHGMAALYSARGPCRPPLDGQGRRALYFSVPRAAGLQAHHWHGTLVALS